MRALVYLAAAGLICLPAMGQRTKIDINTETPEGQLLQQIGTEQDPEKKLALLEQFRLGLTVDTSTSVLNINIPSCSVGAVRGTLHTVVAPDLLGRNYNAANCTSTQTIINDDVDAFNHGFIAITDMGAVKPPNWP